MVLVARSSKPPTAIVLKNALPNSGKLNSLPIESDIVITKHQWGAFHGTELDLQLRRRGIKNIVLCGISTNIGVETTAREAYALGYNQVFATDAMAAQTKEEHDHTLKFIFPRIGCLRATEQILDMIQAIQ